MKEVWYEGYFLYADKNFFCKSILSSFGGFSQGCLDSQSDCRLLRRAISQKGLGGLIDVYRYKDLPQSA